MGDLVGGTAQVRRALGTGRRGVLAGARSLFIGWLPSGSAPALQRPLLPPEHWCYGKASKLPTSPFLPSHVTPLTGGHRHQGCSGGRRRHHRPGRGRRGALRRRHGRRRGGGLGRPCRRQGHRRRRGAGGGGGRGHCGCAGPKLFARLVGCSPACTNALAAAAAHVDVLRNLDPPPSLLQAQSTLPRRAPSWRQRRRARRARPWRRPRVRCAAWPALVHALLHPHASTACGGLAGCGTARSCTHPGNAAPASLHCSPRRGGGAGQGGRSRGRCAGQGGRGGGGGAGQGR